MSREELDDIGNYDFELPSSLIAAHPLLERSHARMLVVDPVARQLTDTTVSRIGDWLVDGDLLVFNDVRVSPVRLHATRATGGHVELLVVGLGNEGEWLDSTAGWVCMTRSSKTLKLGETLLLCGLQLAIVVQHATAEGRHLVRPTSATDPWEIFERAGALPLPPYILKRRREMGLPEEDSMDSQRYQTVFAARPGAVAAPTASLHFDHALLSRLDEAGVQRTTVTLWVGAGTFQPVKVEKLSKHRMHSETWEVCAEAALAINRTRRAGRRVVCVGTTVVRTLESALTGHDGELLPGHGKTDLMVRPGHRFRFVDALLTNFHLPKSTLLALVSAFAGHSMTMAAYRHAVLSEYRFFSYGDAMLIVRPEAT
ncbi:MAG: tRNA preQ1(34) S-adenosylmethionine ribosyltransferase-isomerase QueA [Myxococcales bacterium]|nr:tRNA preQ1(34) S-adenosylmethionine ribosyltransferase-isomerase QueA [Myxococcales bacterium]